MSKFIFDGTDKIIYGDYNPVGGSIEIDIRAELYSEWKRWIILADNAKYPQAFSTTGGDPISGTLSVGAYFFLENDWKIQPASYNHRVIFNGNLYTRDDSSPFLSVAGYSIISETRNSSLTQTITSGSGVTSQDKTDIASLVRQDLDIVNENVKKASILVPATQDL